MKEDSGDLWTYNAEYRVVTTNGVINSSGSLVMGAGVALQARQRFPRMPLELGLLVKMRGNVPFLFEQERVITLPTKNDWRDNSDLNLIVSSVKRLVALVDEREVSSVVMTRPGCGNGRLEWKDVKAEIEGLLDDRFTVLTGS